MAARAFIGTNPEASELPVIRSPGSRDYLLEREHPSGRDSILAFWWNSSFIGSSHSRFRRRISWRVAILDDPNLCPDRNYRAAVCNKWLRWLLD